MSARVPFQVFLLLILHGATCFALPSVTGSYQHIEHVSSRWLTPKEPLDVSAWLPQERPKQPWQYRTAGTAHTSIELTETHALVASVQHAEIPGVTTDMLVWWFRNIQGNATYPGDGRSWSKYLMWHPRDHIYQTQLPPAGKTTAAGAHTAAGASGSSDSTKHGANADGDASGSGPAAAAKSPELWEICELFMCTKPEGWTVGTYPGAAAAGNEQVVKAVTELKQLDSSGLWLSVPSSTGLGETFWNLRHHWLDTLTGVLINSTQVVGVVDPAWRPVWFARGRNAIIRGVFGRGRDPHMLLSSWVQHCIEEVGNLEHILPSLYAQAQQQQQQEWPPAASGGAGKEPQLPAGRAGLSQGEDSAREHAAAAVVSSDSSNGADGSETQTLGQPRPDEL